MLSGMMLRLQRFLDQGVVARGTDEVVRGHVEGRPVAGAAAEVHRAGLGVEVEAAGDGDCEAEYCDGDGNVRYAHVDAGYPGQTPAGGEGPRQSHCC